MFAKVGLTAFVASGAVAALHAYTGHTLASLVSAQAYGCLFAWRTAPPRLVNASAVGSNSSGSSWTAGATRPAHR